MNVVLLSGGSGKRLWPLSNDFQSKQFLKLLLNERGEYESMVQRVMRQLTSAHLGANVFVSCNAAQADILKRQLGDVEMVLEPSRRNTFPAIALSAAYLHYEKGFGENEVFISCPIDVFADAAYFMLFSDMAELVSSGKYRIGLMGAMPTFPTEKYGYFLQRDGKVSAFIEKPPSDEAGQLISQGALWNCGVFALKIGYALSHARRFAEFDSYASLLEQFTQLPQISFDYEAVEKEPSIGAVVYDGVWKDLGTWNTLTEEMSGSSMGRNILISDNCRDTHVLNMLNIPVIAQDLSDIVVIASHDGILVSSKPGTSYIKPLAEQMSFRPMYEQRRWGDYRVLDYKQDNGASSIVKRLRIEAGQSISYQYHSKRSEVWVIVSGEGLLTIDGVDSAVGPGSVIEVPTKAKHSLLAAAALEFIEVQLGEGSLEEDDIVRIKEEL